VSGMFGLLWKVLFTFAGPVFMCHERSRVTSPCFALSACCHAQTQSWQSCPCAFDRRANPVNYTITPTLSPHQSQYQIQPTMSQPRVPYAILNEMCQARELRGLEYTDLGRGSTEFVCYVSCIFNNRIVLEVGRGTSKKKAKSDGAAKLIASIREGEFNPRNIWRYILT
jgi:hypothetical protein